MHRKLKAKLKVEGNINERESLFPLVPVEIEVPTGTGGVRKVEVNPARVGEALRFYMAQEGSTLDSTKVRGELERRMPSRKFLADMEGFLPSGITYSPDRPVTCFSRCFCPT